MNIEELSTPPKGSELKELGFTRIQRLGIGILNTLACITQNTDDFGVPWPGTTIAHQRIQDRTSQLVENVVR